MAWWTDFQRGYRMAKGVEQYLQARAQAQAEFQRELADLEPAGREAAQAAMRARSLVKWDAAGGTLSLLSFAASPEAGAIMSAIVGTRVALLIRKPAQERRKHERIEAFVPMLNEYREILVRYPVDSLSEDVREGVARRITRLAEFMHRLGVPRTEERPEQVVAGHVFRPDGFYAWKPRRVRRLFTQELPHDILLEPHLVGLGFTPELFRTYLDDAAQTLADAYLEAFEKQGNLIYGYVEPIPGVCELPPGLPVGLPLFHEHRFTHTVWFGKTGSGKSTHLVDLIIQDIAAGMGVIVLSPERDFFARLLRYYPAHRADDLIYLDFRTTSGPVLGFTVCDLEPGEQLDSKAGELYTVLTRAMGQELGVTMKALSQNGLYALLQTPGATLTDLYQLLNPADRSFRTSVVRNPALDDKTHEFWLAYENSQYYQASFEPVINRLAPFFRPPLSVVLSTPSWSVGQELNHHSRVVCVDVSHLRGLAQQVVGQLAFGQFQQSFFARDYRTDLPGFLPYQLHADEFARFAGDSEDALMELFIGIRKFRVGLNVALQTRTTISPRLCRTIIGNAGTLGCLRISAEEGRYLAQELQLLERTGARLGPEMADIERAIARERVRLRQLGTTDSHVLQSLLGEWQRAQKARLLDSPEAERNTLRSDLLQNLERGHLILAGVPGYSGCMSVRVPPEPPARAEPFPGTVEELIQHSRMRFGKGPERPPAGGMPEDEPDNGDDDDEDFVVVR